MLKNVILGRGILEEEHGRELFEELNKSGLRVFVAEDSDALEAAGNEGCCDVSETAVLERDIEAAKVAERLFAATAVYCPEESELDKVDFVDYIVTSLEGIDAAFFRLLYCRSFGLALEIAKTKDLVIREYVPADSFAYYELMKSVPADTIRDVPLETFEKFDEWFNAYIGWKYKFYDYGYWGVFKRGDICGSSGEQLVASAGLEVAERTIAGEKKVINELGYLVGGSFQHRGYGTQMLEAVIKYGKQQLGMERICCLIEKDNEPSKRLLERVLCDMGQELTISNADDRMLLFEF